MSQISKKLLGFERFHDEKEVQVLSQIGKKYAILDEILDYTVFLWMIYYNLKIDFLNSVQ